MMKIIILIAGPILLAAIFPPSAPADSLQLSYSTYLGGNYFDYGRGIALDSLGRVYVTGVTTSSDFPVKNAYQPTRPGGWDDVFVTCFDSVGNTIAYSTYIGGSGNEQGTYDVIPGNRVAVDPLRRAYVTGWTYSDDFPTKNCYQASRAGDWDSFAVCLSSSGSALIYSTYLGGSGADYGNAVAADQLGRAYVTGAINSADFPVHNPYQSSYGGNYDGFIVCFSSAGSDLVYSTYFGGGGYDAIKGVVADSASRLYLTGETNSPNDFPILNPYQSTFGGGAGDAFLSCLSPAGSVIYSTYLGGDYISPGNGRDFGHDIALDTLGRPFITGTTESLNFPIKNPYQSTHAGGEGIYYYDSFISCFSPTGSDLVYSTYLGGSSIDEGYGIGVDSFGRAYLTGYTYSGDFPTVNSYQASFSGTIDAFATCLSPAGNVLEYSSYLGGSGEDRGVGLAADSLGLAYITGYTRSGNFPVKNAFQNSLADDSGDAFVTCGYFGPPLPTPTPSYTEGANLDSGDYNGDGKSDIAVFRRSNGLWSVRGVTRAYFGSGADIPVSGDYNGDGITEIGIFRQSSGMWSIRNVTRFYFGSAGDYAAPGDYNGDGRVEAGLFRPSTSLWSLRGVTRAYFGSAGDTPITGYYDGNNIKDIGVFRSNLGLWAVRGLTRFYFGAAGDGLVPGDYSGNGVWEAGSFRPSTGLWSIRYVTRAYFGISSDQVVPADYAGDFRDDIAIFRGFEGLWSVRNLTRIYFGSTGDLPVTR